ncbi:major allergen Pru ar 1-like [Quillaja saponaria]|uniref:Major allergen Pru ar 1-like n=1 Tax=Quillaja saponaria TaxID=32244 RepID=A0AAD7LC59_QUISA|nr:major allergen Pru ar 1-like [Quillaja saponaria]
MGTTTITEEVTSPVPVQRLFKALILEADNLIPKLIPQVIKSVEIIEGNGGPGTIKKTTITEGGQLKYLKHRIDALDKDNLTYGYTLIEGDDLQEKNIESVSYEIKFESTPNGGSKVKTVTNYNSKPGTVIKEEEIEAAKQKGLAVYKAVDAYLLANPEAYAN